MRLNDAGQIAFDEWMKTSEILEHIIRNEAAYHRIADYISNNPTKWNNDCFR